MADSAARLRRSCHFVPGANDKMLSKSIDSNADSLILDLEDAVTPERKDAARKTVTEWLAQVEFGAQERCVRINPLDTPWGLEDIEVTMQHPPDAYVVPKISTLDELNQLASHLDHWERTYGHPEGATSLIVICGETPLSVMNVAEFPRQSRVAALTWGAEDLATALGASRNRSPDGAYLPVFQHCRDVTLLASVAGGVAPIDTVYVDFKDEAGLREDCLLAASSGYTGKLTIHPNQIDVVNELFSPSEADVARAGRLVEAFAEAQSQGLMAIDFEGQMVDVPHLASARRLIDKAEQISSKAG